MQNKWKIKENEWKTLPFIKPYKLTKTHKNIKSKNAEKQSYWTREDSVNTTKAQKIKFKVIGNKNEADK